MKDMMYFFGELLFTVGMVSYTINILNMTTVVSQRPWVRDCCRVCFNYLILTIFLCIPCP